MLLRGETRGVADGVWGRMEMDAKSPSVKFVLLCLWREGRQSQVLVSSQRTRIHARFDLPSQKYAPASSWIDPEDFTTAGASSSTSLNTHHLLSFIVRVLKNRLSVARCKSGLHLTVTFSCAFLTLFEQCRVNYVWGLLHHRFSSNSHFWLLTNVLLHCHQSLQESICQLSFLKLIWPAVVYCRCFFTDFWCSNCVFLATPPTKVRKMTHSPVCCTGTFKQKTFPRL